MKPIDPPTAKLDNLLALFYPDPGMLGQFRQVHSEEMPTSYRQLLDHHSHMTVTLEGFHESPVALHVEEVHDERYAYARKLNLTRVRDGKVVLAGIMRLRPDLLPAAAMAEVRERSRPLGHILIDHDVLREVERLDLWEVLPGVALCERFAVDGRSPVYGRTALIHCNERPAIELLEIVHVAS